MDWRSHIVIGAILAFLALYLLLGTREAIQLFFLSIFGAVCALAPDLDHESSKGRKIADKIAVVLALWIPYTSACGGRICLPISNAVPMVFMGLAILGIYFVLFTILKPRHRGITHTLVACAGFGILVYVFSGQLMAIVGVLGYLSHLVADMHVKII